MKLAHGIFKEFLAARSQLANFPHHFTGHLAVSKNFFRFMRLAKNMTKAHKKAYKKMRN